MAAPAKKNGWVLFLLLLVGIVLGSFIGYLCRDVSFLSWLNYGIKFGFESPFVCDLGVLQLTFGLSLDINVASIFGVLIAILVYKLA